MAGKNFHSTSKLTEFAPLSPEDKQSGVSNFISKFFKTNKNETKERSASLSSASESKISSSQPQERLVESTSSGVSLSVDAQPSTLSNPHFDVNVSEGRSLPNVLKRLSSLVASKNVNPQGYGETDLKQYWMPDSGSRECYDCSERFTTFRRRHHCRICGQIFCFRCCSQEVPGKILGCTGDLRVCTYCWKVVHSYLQSGDMRLDSSYDHLLKNTTIGSIDKQEDDRLGTSCPPSNSYNSSLRRKTSVGYQEERFALGRGQPLSKIFPEENRTWILYALCQQLAIPGKGLPMQTRRARVHQNVFSGSELIDWLIENGKAADRAEASVIGEALVEGRFLESVTDEGFTDSCALYRILRAEESSLNQSGSYDATEHSSVGQEGQEPSWVKEIPHRPYDSNTTTDSESESYLPDIDSYSSVRSSPSTYQLDVDLKGKTVHLRPSLVSSQSPSSPTAVGEWVQQSVVTASPSSELLSYALSRSSQRNPEKDPVPWHQISQLRSDNGDLQAYTSLDAKYAQHEQILLNQLLCAEGLSQTWAEIAMPLIHQMSAVVHPDATNDSEETDIRHYIQFKKITGGTRSECQIVNGIAFTKNVAHRSMVIRLENPRILLLNCAIVYQRVEGRFLSLEPVMMQEQNYLRNIVARIEALKPDLILVSRNVSRIAQESLRLLGITLALNVKLSVLERISRCTQTQIIMSVDALIRRPQLGKCKKFYLRTFNTEQGLKTIMFLEGCPFPQFGCSVLLRGGNQSELSRLKRVFRHMIFCRYHWRLEQSYLMDEFARPPCATSDNFFEEPNFGHSERSSPSYLPESSGMDNKQISVERLEESKEESENQESPADKIGTKGGGDQSSASKTRRKNSADQPEAMKRVTAESVSDFSDPLHQYLNSGEEAHHVQVNNSQILAVAKIPYLNQFRKALDDTILSISPYLKFTVPFLETDQGRSCRLRQYFPLEIYWSRQFHENENSRSRVGTGIGSETLSFPCDSSSALMAAPKHPFMDMKITLPATSSEILEVLAHFRACGGRISIDHSIQPQQYSHSAPPLPASTSDDSNTDVLDPGNHLHLSVLFCSFSTFPQNAPAFCVNPWVVNMDFYGRNDISLGNFLERYCFRTTFECPSQSCSTSMLQHVRRFVHYPGCVQVTLQLVEGVGSLPTNDHILMWSCCSLCSVVSPVTPMSPDTWALSFGKYLELRFHGNMYYLREEHVDKADQASLPCSHSLHHDFYQYFGYRNIVATFKYSPIMVWEVSLPPETVNLDWETEHLTQVSDEINEIAVAGQTIFSQVLERILNTDDPGLRSQLQKDQAQFKAKVEDALVQNTPVAESGHWKILWHLEDTVVDLRRLMIDAVANWNTRLKAVDDRSRVMKGSMNLNQECVDEALSLSQEETAKGVANTQSLNQNVSQFNDIGVTCEALNNPTNASQPERNQVLISTQKETLPQENAIHSTPSRQSSVVDSEVDASYETTQSMQSKSVKTILSQFLPSGSILSPILVPPNLQEVHIMPRSSASIPIAVRESQPSTIIAHALASNEYQRSLEEIVRNPPAEVISTTGMAKESGNIEGVAYSTNLSNTTANALSPENLSSTGAYNPVSAPANNQQNHTYIEVQFSDASTNFFCRIYYAEEFLKLRHLIWPRGEEAFIRSLSHCVDWAARGGKSGSTFCKSRDDRLVLKEMSRTELSHFLDRAPQFFSYMTDNFKSNKPTMMAKILGVYRIVFKNDLTGTASRSNLLVMENLFYGREVSHKFDLKGSFRNRLVNPGSEPRGEIVLLDENLLKITRDSPLYVLPHTKSVLMQALKRDTEFLTSQSVMDYSLLVGLDQSRKELVVGIIDYIRSFTWDKRLENVFKKMAGQGKTPTIVHPEEYQNRFMAAMHSYFLTAPDRWYGFGKGFD
ncbi:putative 1-phosphatidylinositol 3-phosphate 5-kinase isoform X2 [Frankliniella occidentalis]|uniref:1-phosphatidylinositol-3-phosphate 5-kinase n=1 Tax=Frankliniella occidentalis TaxID=133901 RepID=A0A6J1T6D9_FRAOC|nr:putative 1-phosphatidylinositol 3-phosphate 5-kinase isoform X2 [Frankliniella occidentalis]